jgi:methanethiol S-methyltransferase
MMSVPTDLEAADNVVTRRLARAAGVACGLGTQCLFAVTVYRLFSFLGGDMNGDASHAVATDAVLALQFAVPHSVLLLPSVKQSITRYLPREFYGSLYCIATCASLWLIFLFWRATPTVLWDPGSGTAALIHAGFLGSWIGLFYSISLTGFGYQTGWTEWWHWFRRRPLPNRGFAQHGAYRWLRHPIYLSFLGLIWFVPRMTLDHAVLTGLWTVYIFVGSVLKDRRLKFYLGAEYQRYAGRVPGYPGFRRGLLGIWAAPSESMPIVSSVPTSSARRNAA